jgi:hypothetical protein
MASARHFCSWAGFTVLSTIVFCRLKRDDDSKETRQKDLHLG